MPSVDDSFLCRSCIAKGVTPPDVDKSLQHVYTHPLVRCKPRMEDPAKEKVLTTEDRIATLEQRTTEIDAKLTQLVDGLARLDEVNKLKEKFAGIEQALITAVREMKAIRTMSEGNGHT